MLNFNSWIINSLSNLILAVGANDSIGTTAKSLVGSTSANQAQSVLQNVLWGKVFPIVTTVLMFTVILAIAVAGTKLAASTIFNNERTRVSAIAGIIYGIVGSIILINAQPIVSLISGIAFTSGTIIAIPHLLMSLGI